MTTLLGAGIFLIILASIFKVLAIALDLTSDVFGLGVLLTVVYAILALFNALTGHRSR